MSSLAFYASPIEDSPPPSAGKTAVERKRISKGKTIKKRPDIPDAHVAAMIDHIHKSTGTRPDDRDDMGEFRPPGPPESGRTAGDATPAGAHLPGPYAGGDAPVGPMRVEGFETGGPGPTHHGAAHPYVPYYTAAGGDMVHPAPSGSLHGGEADRRDELIKKLDYMIHLLEEQHEERTGHVTEEVILYSFLGVFVIFVVDSFARAGKYVR
jgi:hypothetical protein